MHKDLKAALAALAGAGLLLGGAGSLAYWNDTGDVPGGTITSGSLALADAGCGDWTLDGGAVFDFGSDTVVPGDTLTRTCDFDISAVGDHLTADLTAAAPTLSDSALSDELVIGSSYSLVSLDVLDNEVVVPIAPEAGAVSVTSADDGKTLRAAITVRFPFGVAVDNDSNGGVQSVLDAVTITATQTDYHL